MNLILTIFLTLNYQGNYTELDNEFILCWKNNFEKIIVFNKIEYSDIDSSTCLNDTALGIIALSNHVFYSLNNNYTYGYLPTYLYETTTPTSLEVITQNESETYRQKGAKDYPVEMIKIYYIHSLYVGDFQFMPRVCLGFKDRDLIITPSNKKLNRKILKKANSSLDKWSRLVEDRGLEYVRKHDIDPLYYSNLEWK